MENLLDILISLDERIFLFFNGMHNDFWSHFMSMFTGKFIWAPMYATILFILFRNFTWRTALIFTFTIVLTVLLSDQICASYIRPYVERLRPSNLENEISNLTHIVDGYRGGRYGFPSCHAANSFALATILSLIIRNRRFTWFIFIWALVNSYTRLYIGVHYPGDLLIGGTIGAIISIIIYTISSRISKHIGNTTEQSQHINLTIAGKSVTILNSDTLIIIGSLTTIIILIISAIA